MTHPLDSTRADPLDAEIERNVAVALAEDVGAGDLTAQLVPEDLFTGATVISREHAVLCGTAWFECCFSKLDARIKINWKAADGDRVAPNQILCELKGPARALLTDSFRTVANFFQLAAFVEFIDIASCRRWRNS